MLLPTFAILLAAGAQDIAPSRLGQAIAQGTAPDCQIDPQVPKCRKPGENRYRLNGPAEQMPDAKARAFANDGSECNLVGDKRCTSDGVPLMRQSLSQQP